MANAISILIMNNNLDFLDILSIISFAISVANYEQNLQQSSNDDLMKEHGLDKNTVSYFMDKYNVINDFFADKIEKN